MGRPEVKSANDNTEILSITYSYNDKGQLVSMLSLTMKNGQVSEEVQTNRRYMTSRPLHFEVQTNPKTKTDIYRTRRIGADRISRQLLKYGRKVDYQHIQ